MSASPAKRPRTAGSFSPPSPPYHHLAKSTERSTGFQPTTPASPPYMSPNARADASSTATSVTHGSFSPSTAPTSQPTQEPHNPPPPKTGDADEVMADAPERAAAAPSSDDVIMSESDAHRRTDHDRQGSGGTSAAPSTAPQRPRSTASGPLFKLCEQPYTASRPHPTQNLLALYGLNAVAASVARRDPTTGAKINKLRKSYEGQIKQFQLSGRNKAVSTPGEFMDLILYPDEEWEIQKVMGRDVTKGLPAATLAKLDRATQNVPIKTNGPAWEEWRNIIGTDDQQRAGPTAKSADGAAPGKMKQPLGGNATVQHSQALGGAVRPSAASSALHRPVRPERTGTKRRYNNSSFEGYGEGYGDDDLLDSDADDRNASKKRRRKDTYGAGSPLGMDAGNGYHARMVDVRR